MLFLDLEISSPIFGGSIFAAGKLKEIIIFKMRFSYKPSV